MIKTVRKECESSSEYILPDYLGDVRKILSVSASATPAGKFVSDGEMHISGVVNYNIMYSDSENKLSNIETSSDYDISIKVPNDYIDASADTRVANFNIRLSGPRKLTAKSMVRTSAVLSQDDEVVCTGSAFSDGRTPELLKETVRTEKILFGTSGEREYAEEAERVAAAPDSIEIVTSSGIVRINESISVEGGVEVRGEVVITAIVSVDGAAPFAIKKSVPFNEVVTIENATPDMQPSVDAVISSVSAAAAEDSDGTLISVSAILEFNASLAFNNDVEVVLDGYLKECETSATYSDYNYNELVCMGNSEEHFDSDVDRTEVGCDDVQEILCVFADVRSCESECVNGFGNIKGDISVTAVACQINENSECQYVPVKFTVPYNINVNNNCRLPDGTQFECKVSVAGIDCLLDASVISCSCTLLTEYHAYVPRCVKTMSECSAVADSDYSNEPSVITVYYPEVSESLFDIAKRYHRSASEIAEDNKLAVTTSLSSASILDGVKKLIIR